MRVGLNLIGFVPGISGGSEIYIRNLLHALQRCDTKNEYLILCDESVADEFPISNTAFHLKTVCFQRFSSRWLLRGIIHRATSYDILKNVLDPLGLDVIHHPFTVLNPFNLRTPSVLTFHDMQQEFYPEFFSRAELQRRDISYRRSATEADAVIAISHHVKNNLIEKYGLPPDKIEVVYSGCSSEYHPIADHGALEKIRQAYHITRPFMFYPAATWPHKNHVTLLRVVRSLLDQGCFDGELVLTGIEQGAQSQVTDEINRLRLNERVRLLGYVPVNDLPYIYNLATLLVFPSLFEGFGLPLVEAMASGCPVVCSNVTAMPEIVGDAGVTFDPGSFSDMVETIARVWNDENLRTELRNKGLVRAELFNWEQAALKTEEVFRRVSKGHQCRIFSSML